jgi:hypothetical protein
MGYKYPTFEVYAFPYYSIPVGIELVAPWHAFCYCKSHVTRHEAQCTFLYSSELYVYIFVQSIFVRVHFRTLGARGTSYAIACFVPRYCAFLYTMHNPCLCKAHAIPLVGYVTL